MTQVAKTSNLEPAQRSVGLGPPEPAAGKLCPSQLSTMSRSQPSAINHQPLTTLSVALLTGGDDKPYVLGLAEALTSKGILLDVIGSDDLSVPELLENRRIN